MFEALLWFFGYMIAGEIIARVTSDKLKSLALEPDVYWSLAVGLRFLWIVVGFSIAVISLLIIGRRLRSP